MTTTYAPPAATRRLHEVLTRTPAGRRWERIFAVHEGEVTSLITVHADVRDHVLQAILLFSEAIDSRAVHQATVRAISRALDDFARLGTTELRSTVAGLREELTMLQSSLEELLEG